MSGAKIGKEWRMPEAMWERMEPLLPKVRRSRKGGRPRVSFRPVLDGIFYVLRTGGQWKAVPREFGSGSTLHRYFQAWVARGVFQRLWEEAWYEYDELEGIQWTWQSIDGAMTKAPLGGEKDGPQPHRSGEIRDQAFPAYRWRRRAGRTRGRRSEHA